MTGSTPPQTPPLKKKHSGRNLLIVIVVCIIIIAGTLALVYRATSGYLCGCTEEAYTIAFTQIGNISWNGNALVSWGLAAPFSCTACMAINFTLTPNGPITTGQFGMKVMNTTGGYRLATGWVAILWNAGGSAPLAGYTPGPNSSGDATGIWVAATGATLPITGLHEDHMMLITPVSIGNQGYTLYVFETSSQPVGGGTLL